MLKKIQFINLIRPSYKINRALEFEKTVSAKNRYDKLKKREREYFYFWSKTKI